MHCLRPLFFLLLSLAVAVALPARAQGTRIKDLPLTTTIPTDGRIALDASTFTALRGISVQQLATNLGALAVAAKLDTTNGVAVGLTTATVPTTGNSVVNKTALDAAIAAGVANKLDITNGVASGLTSSTLSSIAPGSVVVRQYLDYVGSTNINNWMAIQTWGDSLTEGSGVGGVTSSNTYPAQLGTYSGFRVANGGVGGETAPQILVRQTAASNTWFQPTIIWAGRNEYWYPTNVLNGVSNMVANLRAGGNTNRFLVLSVLNGNYSGDERGGAGYQTITNINAQFAAAYGSNYLDVRAYLVSRYNPTNAQDVLDYANDIPPSTLRSDGIHLNSSGYPAVAAYILTNGMATLRGAWGPAVRPSGVTAILRQPGPIGSESKSTGDFTSLTGNTLGVGSVTVTNGLTAQSLASVSSSVGSGTATNSYISPAFTVTGSGYSSTAYLSGNGALWVFTGGLAPDANGTRDLGVGGLAWRNITATGVITAGSASLASETLGSLVVTNGITAGSLTASGAVASTTSTTGSAVATNSFKAPAILVQGSGSSYGTLSLSGDNSAIITDKKLMPAANGTLSLGYGYDSYQWLHGFFSGKLWSDSLQTTNGAIAALTAGSVTTTNAITAASVTASGAIASATSTVGSAVATNSFKAPAILVQGSGSSYGTLSLSGDNSAIITDKKLMPAANGTLSLGYGYDSYQWLHGFFSGKLWSDSLQTTNGAIAALTAGSVTTTNAITAGSATISGALSAGSATVGSVTVTNAVTAASVTASGALSGGSAAITGAAAAGSLTTGSAVVTNAMSVGGTLTGAALRGSSLYITNTATANQLSLVGAGTVSAYVSGAGNRWVLTGGFDPETTATYSLGQSGLRWLNAVLSGTVTASKFTSEVATGTAPLTVASTTEVANLRAATATALANARTINGVSFDGTANVTVTAAAATLTGLGTGVGTALGLTPTGSGVIVLATNAVLTTPTLGVASATSMAVSSGLTAGSLLSFGSITAGTTIAAGGAVTGSNLSGTNTGDQTITLTGAVTGSGTGSFATTLATVTETKGGTAQTTYSTGDTLYASAANTLAKRAIGSSGQVLTVSGGVPTWATPSSGGSSTAWVTFSGSDSAVAGLGNGAFVATSQTVTMVAHGLVTGDVVWFTSDMGATIQLGIPYYVTVLTSSTFKLSVTTAARIASTFITADTTGNNYMTHWTSGGTGVVAGAGVDGISHSPTTATGKFVIGFSAAMTDDKYVMAGSAQVNVSGTPLTPTFGEGSVNTTNCSVWVYNYSSTLSASPRVSVNFTR